MQIPSGEKSDLRTVNLGVPQGSVLGPILFLIYINDLPAATNLKTVLYADDSNLLIKGNDLQSICHDLNDELTKICDYFKANKLKLNTGKTKLVCFRKKRSKIDLEQLEIYLDGVSFESFSISLNSNPIYCSHLLAKNTKYKKYFFLCMEV